jgi:glutamate-5-semialdehyde dehydrogenase
VPCSTGSGSTRGEWRRFAASVDEVRGLPDPVGELVSEVVRPNGLRVRRVRVPLGVVAMVYEARPNVTVEASALCLKAGDAIVLRGGSEAIHSNRALLEHVRGGLADVGLPEDAASLVPFTDRDAVRVLVQQTETVDLAIPRGGRGAHSVRDGACACPRRPALQGCVSRLPRRWM